MSDRVVIVTGSSRGIGRAIAVAFAAQGGRVVVNYRRSEAQAREVLREIESAGRGECLLVKADVSREGDAADLIARTVERFGRLDVLVNNAGYSRAGRFLDITLDQWHEIIENNLTSTFLCCRAAAPHMVEAGWGRIINIASTSGMTGGTSGADYAAAKGGVIALTKALSSELAPLGVTVNAVVPSKIETDQLWGLVPSEQEKQALLARIPVKRFGTPQEIAALVVFLASENAGYITGEPIVASGGY